MTPPRERPVWPVLAGEMEPRGYVAAPAVGRSPDALTASGSPPDAAARQRDLDALSSSLDRIDAAPLADLAEPALKQEMAALQVAARRIEARIAKAASTLTSRRATAVRAAGGDERTVDQARREARGELAQALRLSPSKVRQAERVGDRLDATPAAAAAFTSGDVSARHLQILDRTLAPLTGDVRRQAEADLVQAAREQSTVEFADTCTRLLARLDRAAATRAEELRHARRTTSVVRTADGMTRVVASLAGIQAEIAATAIHAYRRPDPPGGERRTAEQRTADALVAALQSALDQKAAVDGGAPTRHGVRPHVIVTVDLDTLVDGGDGGSVEGGDEGSAVAEGEWAGPLIWQRVRRVLDDAGMSFIAIGDDLPIAVTSETRNVPVGLVKALALRDGGCIHEACDMPPWWCQVMHLGTAYRHGGRLDRDSAGLGCSHHHAQFDGGRLDVHWTNGRPVLRPPPDP